MNVRLARLWCAAGFVLALGVTPAVAQVDFPGEWAPRFWEEQPERVPGPDLGDYAGIPISDAARLRAEAWDASIQSLPEWQCRPHSADYIWRGPSNLRISKEVDPVSRGITAFHAEWLRSVDRAVYLDGRPHPPEGALHSWGGYSTAQWDGDMLTVTVSHLKEGYLRRNGLPRSDRARLTEHWIRNGDFLTVCHHRQRSGLPDRAVRRNDRLRAQPQSAGAAVPVRHRPGDRSRQGKVPHYAPGKNPYMTEHASRHKLPLAATRGGAETMYPDFGRS